MRQSIRLGRIAGIDIGAHWSVLAIAGLLVYGLATGYLPAAVPGQSGAGYTAAALAIAVAFLTGLLAHELAHALVARHYGIGVRRITLWLLGGVSELENNPNTPRADFLVAAAGPATSLGLGAAAAAGAYTADSYGAARLVVVGLTWLAGVNIILGVFNLLPGAPLDGGRVLRAALWWRRGNRAAASVAADRAGAVVGFLLAGLGVFEILFLGSFGGLWLVLLGWFLYTAARAETADTQVQTALGGRTVADLMSRDPLCGHDGQSIEAFLADVATGSRHKVFPMIDIDGRFAGMVHLARIVRTAPAERGDLRLRDIAVPASRLTTLEPAAPATAAPAALSILNPLVAVTENGRLLGVVSATDIAHAVQMATLHQPSASGGPPLAAPGTRRPRK